MTPEEEQHSSAAGHLDKIKIHVLVRKSLQSTVQI